MILTVFILLHCSARTTGQPASDRAVPTTHDLKASPKTVSWGYYDAAAKPVLRIKSGDIVNVHTLITNSPAGLEGAFIRPDEVEQSLRDVFREVKDKGPGGHILTGPIYVEGAEPGDTLEVRIKKIKLAIPYGYNGFAPKRGFLPEDYPRSRMKIIRLDEKRMLGKFAKGIEIPLKPFFGCMGVAPPPEAGRVSSAPPGIHAGNLDNKELVEGTTLFIPVHARGALFAVGDGHAAQGNGEIDITALETSLHGTLQFVVRKDMKLRWPRAETPTHHIVMGLDKDLTRAMKIASREAVAFLTTEKGLSPDDAYMLASMTVDFCVTQVVDGTLGVHGMIPKRIFKKTESPASTGNLIARPADFTTLVNPQCSHCRDEAKRRAGELKDDDRVLCWLRGYSDGGCIPYRFFLNPYRVISDTYGVFVHDPDAGFARGFAASLDFRFHGWRNGVMVMQHKDGTLYSCLSGLAFDGPNKGRRLSPVPTLVSDWGFWLKRYPGAVAYHMFDKYRPVELPAKVNEHARSSRPNKIDGRLDAEAFVLGVTHGKLARAYPVEALAKAGLVQDEINGEKCVVLWYGPTRTAAAYSSMASPPGKAKVEPRSLTLELDRRFEAAPFVDRETGSHWDIAGRAVEGELKGWTLNWLDGTQVKWFAWSAEYPDTSIYGKASAKK
jgi:acetamidase/formamidase